MKNKDKASYVKEEIARAFFQLFEEKDFSEISIKEITLKAQVSRVSFYRNFTSKEDILRYYIQQKMSNWRHTTDLVKAPNFKLVIADLFEHYKQHSEFYLLLYKRGFSYLILEDIQAVWGARENQTNKNAYVYAYLTYGLFGWINEWFARGMQESTEGILRLFEEKDEK
ncbi:TetR/AcrR family transcriptional regulator [Paenibacillus sonchi]|uniref:TetR/AcrR family transcriptional regulator n=1 Tax=Paenibacillus sonchi TaxID=373687 RepID=A0A974PD67_9BACL|nr:TetR/AcrR family transcriptional regulator [Paenibacillus sonchi]QQZ61218.1 TetR/AcrR family transcriptional regulator [Paenibacillus sonchi]